MQLRRIGASAILVTFAVLHGYTAHAALASGASLFTWLGICSALFSAGYVLATAALWRGWFWARWLGLGIGVVGVLNCLTFAALSTGSGALTIYGSELGWVGLQGVGFVALLALLSGRKMVAAYDDKPSPRNRWDFSVRSVRILRWAVVLNIAALPMLLKHAGNGAQWMSCGTRSLAMLTALTVGTAVVLVILQRTAGLMLLGLGGVATMYLAGGSSCGLTAMLEQGSWCGSSVYHSVAYQMSLLDTALVSTAFLPGALAALAAVGAFAGPMTRHLRGR